MLSELLKVGDPLPFHKDYEAEKTRRAFWRLSFAGGSKYKDGKDASNRDIFIQHEQESPAGKMRRLSLSVYKNYCKPITQKYNDFVFTSAIERDKDNAAFTEWAKNVDTLGTPLHDFIKKSTLWAAVEKNRYVLFDTTKTAEVVNQAQAKQSKAQVFMVDIAADAVVNHVIVNGALSEALVFFEERSEARLYTETDYQTIQLKENQIISISPAVKHPWGGIPVVKASAVCGLESDSSMLEDIAEINKSIFNMDAMLREELANQTFSQWALFGVKKDDMDEAEVSYNARKFLCIAHKDASAVRLAADVSQAQSIRDTIKGDVQEIYRLAGLHAPEVQEQGAESGRALKIRWNDVEMTAASIADHAEKFENNCIKLWSAGMGGSEVQPTDYPEEFDTEEIVDSLKITLDMLGSQLPFTLKRLQVEEFAKKKFPKMEEDDAREFMKELLAVKDQQEEQRVAEVEATKGIGKMAP